ncbi:hypothetical protein ABIA16_000325 [Sinorhizobium fredii]
MNDGHALIRGLSTAGPDASRSFLSLVGSVGIKPADSGNEGSPAVTVPPALPRCTWLLMGSFLLFAFLRFGDVQRGETWHAIAQTKPDNSRAIAVVTVVAGFPALVSLR